MRLTLAALASPFWVLTLGFFIILAALCFTLVDWDRRRRRPRDRRGATMMRMPFLAELRWLIADHLVLWAFRLVRHECTEETMVDFRTLNRGFYPRLECKTVPMRSRR